MPLELIRTWVPSQRPVAASPAKSLPASSFSRISVRFCSESGEKKQAEKQRTWSADFKKTLAVLVNTLLYPFKWLIGLFTGTRPANPWKSTPDAKPSKDADAVPEDERERLRRELQIQSRLHTLNRQTADLVPFTEPNLENLLKVSKISPEDLAPHSSVDLKALEAYIPVLHKALKGKNAANREQAESLLERLCQIPDFPRLYARTLTTPKKRITIDYAKQTQALMKTLEKPIPDAQKAMVLFALQNLAADPLAKMTPGIEESLKRALRESIKHESPVIKAAGVLGFIRFPALRPPRYVNLLATAINSPNDQLVLAGLVGAKLHSDQPETFGESWALNLALEKRLLSKDTFQVHQAKEMLKTRKQLGKYREINPQTVAASVAQDFKGHGDQTHPDSGGQYTIAETLANAIETWKSYLPGQSLGPQIVTTQLGIVGSAGEGRKLAQKLSETLQGPNKLITLDLHELKSHEAIEAKLLKAAIKQEDDIYSLAGNMILVDNVHALDALTPPSRANGPLKALGTLLSSNGWPKLDLQNTIVVLNSDRPWKDIKVMNSPAGKNIQERLGYAITLTPDSPTTTEPSK